MDVDDSDWLAGLLSEEIPEIASGVVEIKSIARIPGVRSKVAIKSRLQNINAMEACVGLNGSRLHRIIDRLGGERVELVHWQNMPEALIVNALQPAKIEEVHLHPTKHLATIVVTDDQVSFVAGARGCENRDLASQLTGWQIEVLVRKSC